MKGEMKRNYEPIVCEDGFSMSIQASAQHYSHPHWDEGPYTRVEVGFPSEEEPLIEEWRETFPVNPPTCCVYGFVPYDVVLKVIDKHGGLTKGEVPPFTSMPEGVLDAVIDAIFHVKKLTADQDADAATILNLEAQTTIDQLNKLIEECAAPYPPIAAQEKEKKECPTE